MAVFSETDVHHCEVLCDEAQGGPNSNWYHCKSQRLHKNFLTVDEFEMEHLPLEWRDEVVMNDIQNLFDRTVKVTVSYTSENRPDTFPESPAAYPFREYKGSNQNPRHGTGYILNVDKDSNRGTCPCRECEKSNEPKMEYWEVKVTTAAHVVFDSKEAESALIELFYHNDNAEGVRFLYATKVCNDSNERYQTDRCEMTCVTHEKDLLERLTRLCEYKRYDSFLTDHMITDKIGIVVSHPHGACKRISIGKPLKVAYHIKSSCEKFTIRKGTRVSIPRSNENQEDTQHSDHADVNNGPPRKKLKLSSQGIEDENSKTVEEVKIKETVTSKSCPGFSALLCPTGDKGDFKLKVDLEVLPLSDSLIVCDGCEASNWHILPTGTQYVSPDGTKVVASTEIKFYLNDSIIRNRYDSKCFITYDMATCPGSSGACVHVLHYTLDFWIHFGFCSGEGRSGLMYFGHHSKSVSNQVKNDNYDDVYDSYDDAGDDEDNISDGVSNDDYHYNDDNENDDYEDNSDNISDGDDFCDRGQHSDNSENDDNGDIFDNSSEGDDFCDIDEHSDNSENDYNEFNEDNSDNNSDGENSYDTDDDNSDDW